MPPKTHGPEPPPERNETILVVDDEIDFLEGVRRTMTASGFSDVLMAVDIETSLRLVEAYAPVLALVDLDLGESERSGIALIQQLLKLPGGPIPVVLSGDRAFEQFFRAARAGAVDFLVKGPYVDIPGEVARILDGDRGATRGRVLPEMISDLGYLRSFGLTAKEIALLMEFTKGFPSLSELSTRLEQQPVQTRKTFSRIYDKLHITDLHQLIRTLTVCELFGAES